jgi:hypothetical protein
VLRDPVERADRLAHGTALREQLESAADEGREVAGRLSVRLTVLVSAADD